MDGSTERSLSAPVSTAEAVAAEVPAEVLHRPALEIQNLVKAFKDKIAVDGINLTIPRGSFFGLVGRNGAGKTTSLSMATGMLRPTAGTVLIDGINVWENPQSAKSKIGVLPDGVFLFDKLTGSS